MATITCADYSVEFEINHEGYKKWLFEHKAMIGSDQALKTSPAQYLKRHLKNNIEGLLREVPHQEEEARLIQKNMKIADISFAFHNNSIIKKLKKRGNLISEQDFGKLKEYEKKLNDYVTNEKNFDLLTEPTDVFIVFEDKEGRDAALRLNATENKILGDKINFKQASEPSDIIWENRALTSRQILLRSLAAYTAILIFLVLSFWLVTWVSYYAK